ncbi:hypothetical protein [Flindersiella endophytica]
MTGARQARTAASLVAQTLAAGSVTGCAGRAAHTIVQPVKHSYDGANVAGSIDGEGPGLAVCPVRSARGGGS